MAETKARFLADTQKADTTAEAFTWPTGRATQDNYVLAMSDKTTGETTWQVTATAPTITGITSGQLNSYYDADGTTVSNDKGGTLVIAGSDFGTDISSITAVKICASDGTSQVTATTLASLSDSSITATWNGTESGYSTFSGVYHVEMVKSGLTSNRFNSTKSFSGDPTISSVTGTGGEGESVTVSASDLGTYGGTIAGGGQDSNTKLLLNFDRTGGTDIEDSSNTGGDGHKVTATNALIKASPFGDGKSAIRINGSTHKLQMGNSTDFNLGTSACVEFWIYQESTVSPHNIINHGGVGTTDYDGWTIGFQTVSGQDDGINFYRRTSGTSYTLSSGGGYIKTNHWHHVAYTRDGTTARIFIDGKLANSGSDVTATTVGGSNNDLKIGIEQAEGGGRFAGYIDEIRIVNGSAVYTSDFDVPSSRLTAIPNTKLLIHSNLEVGDSSSHKRPVYAYGPIQISDSVAKTNRGSTTHTNWNSSVWQSDGAGDKLEIPFPDIGTGDFTIDFWVYPQTPASSATDNDIILIDSRRGGTTGWFLSWHKTNNTWRLYTFDGSTQDDHTFSGVTSAVDGWDHVAVQRSSGTIRLWVNGTQASNTDSHSNALKTGSYGAINVFINESSNNAHAFKGYLDEFRISSVARYSSTTTISVPTGAYTSDDDTLLLLHGDGGVFNDSATSGTTHDITVTGSHHYDGHGGIAPALPFPASLKKTGSAGLFFNGTNSYALVNNSGLTLGTTFTIEMWVYFLTKQDSALYHHRYDASNDNLIWYDESASSLKIDTDETNRVAFTFNPSTHRWYHLALSVNNSTATLYVDGSSVGLASGDATLTGGFPAINATIAIGMRHHGDKHLHGYLDGYRVQQGVAAYSSNFTPPTHIYGAYFPQNPSVGTITITGATTDSTDIAFTEISSSLPNGLTLNDQGAGNQTATITGTLTDSVTSDTTTSNIRIQAKANNDDKRITEVNESSGTGNVSITKKAGVPILFNARRFAGNSTNRDINGLGFRPDFCWIKARDIDHNHQLFDSVRGPGKTLHSDSTNDEVSTNEFGYIDGFNNDGFSLKGGSNANSHYATNHGVHPFISWAWKAGGPIGSGSAPTNEGVYKLNGESTERTATTNPVTGSGYAHGKSEGVAGTTYEASYNVDSGFAIIKTTSPGDGTTGNTFPTFIGTPDVIFAKQLDSNNHWFVYHSSAGITSNHRNPLYLNLNERDDTSTTNAWGVESTIGANSGKTWDLGSNNATNNNGTNHRYVYYLWKSVPGVSAFGTYSGASSATTVYTDSNGDGTGTGGFSPSLVIVKRIDGTGDWYMYDKFRGVSNDNANDYSATKQLRANTSASETSTNGWQIQFLTNAFKIPDYGRAGVNNSGETYIYMAFA